MKTNNLEILFVLLFSIIFQKNSFSQLGINSNGAAPATNAILDVSSTSKGVLLPRMTTAQRLALTPSLGLTIFDIDLKSYWFYNGLFWQEITGGSFNLPYSAAFDAGALVPVFSIKTLTSNGYAIKGESGSLGIGVYGKSTSGDGVYGESDNQNGVHGVSTNFSGVLGFSTNGSGGYFSSPSGSALYISGKFNSNGSLGNLGAALTINNSGLPTWQDPISFSVNDLGAANLSVPTSADTRLPFAAEEFDLGNDYSTVNSEFTAPIKGVYHFDAFALWAAHTNGTGYVSITIRKNNGTHSTVRLPAINGKESSCSLSVDMLLLPNDKVYVVAFQNSGVAQSLIQDGRTVRFSGHLVAKQ